MRQIIVTQTTNIQNYIQVGYVFWLTTPSAQISSRANATAVSVAPNVTTPELAALQAGSIVEQTGTMSFASGTGVAAIQAALIAAYNAAQTALNSVKTFQFYGSSWDGTTWTILGG